jgi:hypothetical protein
MYAKNTISPKSHVAAMPELAKLLPMDDIMILSHAAV